MKLKQRAGDTEAYIESNYDAAHPMNSLASSFGVVVFDFQGPLIFINSVMFRFRFDDLIGNHVTKTQSNLNGNVVKSNNVVNRVHTIIFDCSPVTYIDQKGVEQLKEIIELMAKHNVRFALASCNEAVYCNLEKCKFFNTFNTKHCYLTVHDAFTDLCIS